LSLLVVGSVAFDAVESPYGKVERTLGGAATYFAVAASFFTPVNLVGIVGKDFSDKDETIFRGRRIISRARSRAPTPGWRRRAPTAARSATARDMGAN